MNNRRTILPNVGSRPVTHAPIRLTRHDHDVLARIRDHLPTTQEIGAYALFFCLVWGVLILVMLEALP